MSDRPLRVAIAGETIPYMEGGLGYFLWSAVHGLADAEPSWRFKLVASSGFSQLADIRMPNVDVSFWDTAPVHRAAMKLLGKVLPKGAASQASYKLSQYVPSQSLRARWGDLAAMWATLGAVDAVWVPHFSIRWGGLSLMKNLRSVRAPILLTIHDIHPVFFPDDWSPQALEVFWKDFVPFAKRSQMHHNSHPVSEKGHR